ncbi:MAG TPA: alpha/beta hydrolase [Chitinophagaceae bacterium]|nr:alpha/beta hydrolase [Chitinophagaceae bacterium]
MFSRLLPVIVISFTALSAFAQPSPGGVAYKDAIYSTVVQQKNLTYRQDPALKKRDCLYDWYEASADTAARRPLIIWLHGGGFKFGKKRSGGLPLWSKAFARRGYVCAAINYRRSKKHPLKNYPDLVEGCADAVEDTKEAIRYFKQHAKAFRIDSNHIILAGNSAGGMIALQAVYSSPAEMARLIHRGDSVSASAQLHNPEHVAGIMSYWGALFSLKWLQNGKIPLVTVHGSKDRVVPNNDPSKGLYGSQLIHTTADSLQIPNAIKIFDGYAHELQKHFNPLFAGGPARKRWVSAGNFAAAFLYDTLFRVK